IAREEPEELLHEAQAAGRDTKTIADKMRNAAAAVLKEFEQRKLSAARQTWQERSQPAQKPSERIATTPEGRRSQLLTILEANPEIGEAVTTQHRDFRSLSDEDVEGALEDLAELGFLNRQPGTPSEE